MEKLDCTLVFVNENIMNPSQLLLKHRLIIMEMNEHYLNYMSKKTLAIDCLDSIKSNMKLQSLGERTFDTGGAAEQRVQMCKLLYSKSLALNNDQTMRICAPRERKEPEGDLLPADRTRSPMEA